MTTRIVDPSLENAANPPAYRVTPDGKLNNGHAAKRSSSVPPDQTLFAT